VVSKENIAGAQPFLFDKDKDKEKGDNSVPNKKLL